MIRWHEYVQQVIGADRQIDVAAKTGLNQPTISRWLNPSTSSVRRSSQNVRAFARGYGIPVVEAFVVAGFLTPEEAGMTAKPVVNRADVLAKSSQNELLRELKRRMG